MRETPEVDPSRPFRHLCTEADMRDAMTDSEFWEHVDASLARTEEQHHLWLESWSDPQRPEVDIATPCTVCGGTGPCGYDPEGLPYIHVEEDE